MEGGSAWGAHPASCPVRAVKEWLETANIKEWFLLRAVDRHGRIRPEGLRPDPRLIGAIHFRNRDASTLATAGSGWGNKRDAAICRNTSKMCGKERRFQTSQKPL